MRTISFFIIISFYITNCFGQDTVERKNRLSNTVIERFHVLKSNPEIRQGPYAAYLNRRILIAAGHYKDNKKTGTWYFFDSKGKLVERYSYDKKTFGYESPLDAADNLRYLFDDSLKKGDRLIVPVKIGGIYFGYLPYVNLFHLPFDSDDVDTYDFAADIELLISPLGRLADYKVRVVSEDYEYDQTFRLDVKLFSEEDRTFVPATFNGQPALSRILIKCVVTPGGGLDFF